MKKRPPNSPRVRVQAALDRSGRAQGALPEAATAPSAAPPDVVNLERRVKRHVHAPVHGWFAACAPGVEPVLVVEARALGLEDVAAIPGGVTFWGKLEAGYRANLHLRTANRVWLRVMDFSARAPEDVYREAHECPWEAFLPAGVPLLVEQPLIGTLWVVDERQVRIRGEP